MAEERRKYPRMTIPLDGRWLGASGGSTCHIGNISPGGCYIHTTARSVEGHGVVSLYFGPEGSLSIAGRVIHAERGRGFGVKFRAMSPELELQLQERIENMKSAMVA